MLISAIAERRLNPLITVLDVENAHAAASLSLWGGHVLSFRPKHDGRERLFMSPTARWDGSKSIRGGIPVCWPWFGAHKEGSRHPMHGYVRTRPWVLRETTDEDEHTRLLLQCPDTQGEGFDGHASLCLEVLVGRTLTVKLLTRNTGAAPFRLTAALHTYFAVEDIRRCELLGLQGPYSDKTRDWAMLETPRPYRFTEETDRIHLHAAPRLGIIDGDTRTHIRSTGHDSIVVWNPWEENSRKLPDMGEGAFARMLCVETAVTQGIEVAAEQSHVLTQVIE